MIWTFDAANSVLQGGDRRWHGCHGSWVMALSVKSFAGGVPPSFSGGASALEMGLSLVGETMMSC